MLKSLNSKKIVLAIKQNFIGFVTLLFSIGFIVWSIRTYFIYKEKEKELTFYVKAASTLNKLEEDLIIQRQLIDDPDAKIEQEKSYSDVIRQNKNAIVYLQEKTRNIDQLRYSLGNHYAFLMYLEKDYNNFNQADSISAIPYKKRFTNTLFIVVKSNKRLVTEIRQQLALISLELEKIWKWFFIMILCSCIIAISLSVMTFLLKSHIYQRKQIEKKLVEKDKRLEMIYNQIPTIIYTCDTNLIYTAAKGEELLKYGIDTNRLINKVSVDKLHKGHEMEEITMDAHHRALKGENVHYEHKFYDRFFDMAIHPLLDGKKIIGIIGVAIDITERKNAQLLLEMKNKELDSFVYKASHDMRGALSNIISGAELIKEEPLNSYEYANIIIDKAQYLALLLNDMLELTKVSKYDLDYNIIDINDLINNIIENTNQKLLINTKIILTNNTQTPFNSDRKLLKSIFINLIGNAIKYKKNNNDKHQVKILIEENSNKFLFKISDNGCGISPEYHNKIFDMFYRINTDTEGSGLGLFIVQSAVKRLNGEIKMDSTVNNGTTFIVLLPNMPS